MEISKISLLAWESTLASGRSSCAPDLAMAAPAFPKDVAAFSWVAQQQGLSFQILEEVRKINENQQEVFFSKVKSALWTLRGKKLAVLGLAFKGGTDDIRESPAIVVIRKLIEAGCTVFAYDPSRWTRPKLCFHPHPPCTTLPILRSSFGRRRASHPYRLGRFRSPRSGALEGNAAFPHRD